MSTKLQDLKDVSIDAYLAMQVQENKTYSELTFVEDLMKIAIDIYADSIEDLTEDKMLSNLTMDKVKVLTRKLQRTAMASINTSEEKVVIEIVNVFLVRFNNSLRYTANYMDLFEAFTKAIFPVLKANEIYLEL